MKKDKTSEALLVIVTGFLILYCLYDHLYLLYISLSIGVIGIVIKPLGVLIAKGWYKLGDLFGYVVSKVVLSIMFYVLLVPIALLHNLFNKDALKLKRSKQSMWIERNHQFISEDLKNIW